MDTQRYDLSGFKSLTFLRLGHYASEARGWKLSDDLFSNTIATLPSPPTLRHLVLGIERGENLKALTERLSHPTLQNLASLELPGLKRSNVSGDEEDALLDACERRSMALEYADGPVETS